MKTPRTKPFAAALAMSVALFVPQLCQSQTNFYGPFGRWTNAVSDSGNAVWDLSAISNIMQLSLESLARDNTTNLSLFCPISFLQDGGGVLRGVGPTTVYLSFQDSRLGWTNVEPFEGKFNVSGQISSAGSTTKGYVQAKVSGRFTEGGKRRSLSATRRMDIILDNAAKTYSTKTKDRGSLTGMTSSSTARTVSESGPVSSFIAGDGSWTLNMSLYTFLAGDVHRVRGSATVTLNSGEIHLFSVRGSYRPRDKQSRLWLIGAGLSSSSRLLIYMQSNNISSIKGTIAGQSVQVAY